jgi:hypothetical protein
MFTITSTRIVGLIAVVCAAIVAPQAALAMPIIDSQDATATIIAPPGNEPRGLELGDLKNGRALFTAATPDAVQGNDLSGFDLGDLKSGRAVFTAATPKNVKAATFVYTPTNPGWGAAATAAKESAAALAVKTAPLGWFCFDQAKYEYVHKACE